MSSWRCHQGGMFSLSTIVLPLWNIFYRYTIIFIHSRDKYFSGKIDIFAGMPKTIDSGCIYYVKCGHLIQWGRGEAFGGFAHLRATTDRRQRDRNVNFKLGKTLNISLPTGVATTASVVSNIKRIKHVNFICRSNIYYIMFYFIIQIALSNKRHLIEW